MGCRLCVSKPKLYFEEEEDVIQEEEKNEEVYELLENLPTMWITPEIFAKIREAILHPHSVHAAAFKRMEQYCKQLFASDNIFKLRPYAGKDKDIFNEKAEMAFNSLLYISIVGAISSNKAYLIIGKQILLSWAMMLPMPGTQLVDNSHPARLLAETGLTISRFVGRITESYRLLAATMTNTEIFFVKRWLIALGATIKSSHKFRMEMYKYSGPQYQFSWHVFGMSVIGAFTGDEELLQYALQGENISKEENFWSFNSLLSSAIYTKSARHARGNIHDDHNDKANIEDATFSFNGQVEPGEMWDRYKTRDVKSPNTGFACSLLNLRAIVNTAHLINGNDICKSNISPFTTISNFKSEEETAELGKSITQNMNLFCSEAVLMQSLHFYGKYFILYPVGTKAHITYPPYQGQQPLYEDLAQFLVALHHVDEDKVLQRVIDFNIMTPWDDDSIKKSSPKKRKPIAKLRDMDEDYRLLKEEYTRYTPICYLALLFCPHVTNACSEISHQTGQ